MSLATSVRSLLAREDYEHYTTAEFCEILESAVKFMQTKHKKNHPVHFLDHHDQKDFTLLLWEVISAGRRYMLAAGVLLLYEYIITMDMEVGLIWKRRKRPLSAVPIIFFLNRYLPLVTFLFVVAGVQYADSDFEFCSKIFAHFPSALIVISEIVVGVLRIIKIRAFWANDPKQKVFLGIVLVVFLLQVSLAIACASAVQGIGPLFFRHKHYGCFLIFQGGSMPRLIVHWFISIVFNALTFYSIMRKSIRKPRYQTNNAEITGVVLFNVRLILIVVSLVQIASLLMVVLFPYWNAINWFCSSLADVILTCRLLFNIRRQLLILSKKDQGSDSVLPLAASTNALRLKDVSELEDD